MTKVRHRELWIWCKIQLHEKDRTWCWFSCQKEISFKSNDVLLNSKISKFIQGKRQTGFGNSPDVLIFILVDIKCNDFSTKTKKEPKRNLKDTKLNRKMNVCFCKSPDSLELAFLACSVTEDFYYEMMTWFNNEQKSQISMTKQQILFKDFTLPIGSQHPLKWKFWIFQH